MLQKKGLFIRFKNKYISRKHINALKTCFKFKKYAINLICAILNSENFYFNIFRILK